MTYTVRGEVLWVRYLYPSWYPLTHPGLADPETLDDDDDDDS